MTNARAILLTGRREVRELLRSRAFRISTVIQLAIVVAVVVISGLTGGDGTDKFEVGYVGLQARAVVEAARSQESGFDAEISSNELGDDAAARAAVEGESVDAAVTSQSLIVRCRRPWSRCCRVPRGRSAARARCGGRGSATARSRRRSTRRR